MLNLTTMVDLKGPPSANRHHEQHRPADVGGQDAGRQLKAAGETTTYRNYEGVTHEFFGMVPVVSDAEKAQDVAAQDFREAFAGKFQGV